VEPRIACVRVRRGIALVVLEAAAQLSETETKLTTTKRSPEPEVGNDRNEDSTAPSLDVPLLHRIFHKKEYFIKLRAPILLHRME
jgi:hypothetical protein